jgi:hypothetical protein
MEAADQEAEMCEHNTHPFGSLGRILAAQQLRKYSQEMPSAPQKKLLCRLL